MSVYQRLHDKLKKRKKKLPDNFLHLPTHSEYREKHLNFYHFHMHEYETADTLPLIWRDTIMVHALLHSLSCLILILRPCSFLWRKG